MTLPAAAVGFGSSLAANEVNGTDPDAYTELCRIRRLLEAQNNFAIRQRERSPYIIEIFAAFAAGVKTAGAFQDWIAPSSFNIETIVLTASATLLVELRIGTRGPRLYTNAIPYPLPYHINGGMNVGLFDGGAAGTGTVYGFLVGWLEENRKGPVADIGDVNA